METFYSQGLKVKYFTGQYDDQDKEIVKSKTYSNVKNGAVADNMFEVAQALVGLTAGELRNVYCVKVTEISE